MPDAQAQTGFHSLGLHPAILTVLDRRGFVEPTPIQRDAIPVVLTGRDVIGIAQTGTGKTLAFGLPLLQALVNDPQSRALILLPTRELAIQVEENLHGISRQTGTVVLIGGAPMYQQIRQLRERPRVLIATPGRLVDHLNQRNLNLDGVKYLVLDEADRMLDMGFEPQLKQILAFLHGERQTLLFSATMAPEVARVAAAYQKEPVRIEVATAGKTADRVAQEIAYISKDGKRDLLARLLTENTGTVLIFSRTKHGAAKLNKQIQSLNHSSAEIHSDRSLGQRRQALDGFKNGRYRILVATDIAARGIDVKDISLVLNYDLPDAAEDYVHRIGRTGRAGKEGRAVSFATPDQYKEVKQIERTIGMEIPVAAYSEQPEVIAEAPRGTGRSRRGGGERQQQSHGGQRRDSHGRNGRTSQPPSPKMVPLIETVAQGGGYFISRPNHPHD